MIIIVVVVVVVVVVDLFIYSSSKISDGRGGIAPNQVTARSEFEVHSEIYTE